MARAKKEARSKKRSEGSYGKTDEQASEIRYERTRRENFRAARFARQKTLHTHSALRK